MQKIKENRRILLEAAVAAVGAVLLLACALSQRVGIGQTYQQIYINDQFVGNAANNIDVRKLLNQARRELALESEDRLRIDYEWRTEPGKKAFETLMTEGELNAAFKDTLTGMAFSTRQRAYSVAIEGYHANFSTIGEVEAFLEKVKAPSDEQDDYNIEFVKEKSHIGGILNAVLKKRTTDTADERNQNDINNADCVWTGAGVGAAVFQILSGVENPVEDSYDTGVLDIDFVETVAVYENFVLPDAFADMDAEVTEVTKEKESNKIYVVESGDCLSVIAMDNNTTVSSIMALNSMENADTIREGQELIIAVPEPDLQIRMTMGEVYEEDYTEEPVIIDNDSWYTTKEVVLEEGTTGHRERNDVVVYENGIEVSRTLVHQNIMVKAEAAVIERGTIKPPTYIKPLYGGRFSSGFGYRWGRLHKGVDFACPVGTTVFASCGGTVIQAGYNGGYGNNVVISHPDGRMTRYAHNSKLLVHVGQQVEQGEAIALSGNTGRSTGPHVHFEIYINGAPVNPLKYISN